MRLGGSTTKETRMLERALKAGAPLMLILAAVAVTAQTRRGLTTNSSSSQPLVRGISIHDAAGGSVIVDIAVTQAVPYRILQLSNPKRLVVDLKGARKEVQRDVYPAQSGLLERVRVGQWQSQPAIARVVADLKGDPAFSIHAEPSGIRIELKPRTTGSRPAQKSGTDYAQSAGNTDEDRALTARQDPAPEAVFPVHRFKDLSASLTAPELPPQDRLIPVTNPDLSAPSHKQSAALALVSGISITPDSRGETFVDIASTRSVPYHVFQLADPYRLVVDLKDARNATRKDVYPVDSPVLKRIRVGQWRPVDPAVVRVVADLAGYPIFDVHAERPGIRIQLMPRRKLGPLIRNPFEFATQHPASQFGQRDDQSNQAITAATNSVEAVPGNSFSDLKVIGYVEKPDSGIQAIISGHTSIYFVPKGGIFENKFRVIAISSNAVEVQDVDTLQTSWLAYTR